MKNKIEKSILIIIFTITIIALIYGILEKVFEKDVNEKYKDEINDSLVLVPEHYIKSQIAFINWDKLYKYFENIKDAEDCKDNISRYLLKEKPEIKVWYIEDILCANNVLSFSVKESNLKYTVKINEMQMMIRRG